MKKQVKAAEKTAAKPAEKTAKKPAAKKPGRKPGRKAGAKKPGTSALKSVTFTVHAEANQDVRLAGSFTDWETKAKKMTFKKRKGVYTATVKLAPGEYQYKFVIDGTWCADPENENSVKNDQGTFNSVVVVK